METAECSVGRCVLSYCNSIIVQHQATFKILYSEILQALPMESVERPSDKLIQQKNWVT